MVGTGLRPCPKKPCCRRPTNEVSLTIDRHALKFTNLNKVFYPAEGIVKRDLLNYYDAVAGLILPHLKDRPLSLKRYPNGITAAVLLSEGRAAHLRALAARRGDLFRPQRGAHPLRLRRGPRQPAVSGQPGLHRPQPLDEPLAHARQSRFRADRPRPAGLPLRHDRGSRPAGARKAGRHRAAGISQDHRRRRHAHLHSARSRSTATTRAAPSPRSWRTWCSATGPNCLPRRAPFRSARRAASISTGCRTANRKPSPRRTCLRAYPGAPVATPLAWSEVQPRADARAVQYLQRSGTLRQKGRSVRRRADETCSGWRSRCKN